MTQSKSNDEDKKPFLLNTGIGDSVGDRRLSTFRPDDFRKESWVEVIKHCKHEIAWNIWEKEYKETVKRKGGLSIRALQMAHRSKKHYENNIDDVKIN